MTALRIPLTHLAPEWLRWISSNTWERVDGIGQAQGIRFLCPRCYTANGGPIGTHSIICWSRSRGVADSADPGPGRWKLVGSCFADLTLLGDAPGGGGARSVKLTGGCEWHGFVTEGIVT